VNSYGQWAYEDRLVDLPDEILPSASLFDPDALGFATLFDATFGRRALYAARHSSVYALHEDRNLHIKNFRIRSS
jgi:hypothetical protein